MELKQLKYFVTVAETGSLNKAAKLLYTTQPNVTKVIKKLESTLEVSLFERTSKGTNMTPAGQKMYEYASNVLKNAYLVTQVAKEASYEKVSISCFPSVMISGVFRRFYSENIDSTDTQVELLEGTVEEIMDNVGKFRSEIGILYFANKRGNIFEHILDHKNLEFVKLESARICLYPGRKSKLYGRKKVSVEELAEVKLIHLPKDFFAIEHDLEMVSVGMLQISSLFNAVSTNSNNLLIDMLSNTDVCYMGLYLMHDNLRLPDMNVVEIEGFDRSLNLGYVKRKNHEISQEVQVFLTYLDSMIQNASK